MFSPYHVWDALNVVGKKRPGPNRKFILLGIPLFVFHIMPHFGEKGLQYTYTQIRYDWKIEEYSRFSSITQAISLTGKYKFRKLSLSISY